MSAKWVRSKAWDDRHLTGPLLPVKLILRTLSSVGFAVFLLILVALYGILASVPIGLIALAPTWAVYALTLVLTIAVGAVLPAWSLARVLRWRGVGGAGRFVAASLTLVVLVVGCAALWQAFIWPVVRYDDLRGTGLRFFPEFVERYKSVQLRRLPAVEKSELEFYAWWPLATVLGLFVLNLITATVRRIEFVFVNLGVLSVHTGIVLIALGSAYYATHKQEGDVVLLSGALAPSGEPSLGRPENGFYDNIRVALWATTDASLGWEQRPLEGVPRYNDYNLGVVPGYEDTRVDAGENADAGAKVAARAHTHRDFGPLDVLVPEGLPAAPDHPAVIPSGVTFRIVGYASYADLIERWVPQPGAAGPPVTMRELHAVLKSAPKPGPNAGPPPTVTWRLIPQLPAERIASLEILNVEHTQGMSDERWRDLGESLPPGARHALVVEVPAGEGREPFRAVYGATPGATIAVGDTGWTLDVKSVEPEPPFPIVTKGYQGAKSSVAVVRITPPEAVQASGLKPFERWVYHRFPEISQDLSDELNERGMPRRSEPDARIRIGSIDAASMQVYVDERPDGTLRTLVRMPAAGATITSGLKEGDEVALAPQLGLRIGAKTIDVRRVELPKVVPESEREKARVGNQQAAAVAVEVREPSGQVQVHWLPFTQYLGMGTESLRKVTLSDGREITLAFGRVRHEFFPPMSVRLADFAMTPYPHSTTPKDYRSDVVVGEMWTGQWRTRTHATSLNEPLLVRAPFVPREDVPAFANFAGRLVSVVAPNQYKFSQAGWDQGGWRESEQAVARGELKRPMARFTILGVGSNPGIYIIATGGVTMALGIPWAFYVKPWILRRRKRTIQQMLARSKAAPSENGTHAAPSERGPALVPAARIEP